MPKFILQQDNVAVGNNTFTGTSTLSGATTISGALTLSGTTTTISGTAKTTNPVVTLTNTDIDAQNATPTAAQMLGGMITHTSVTGAGTCTVPLGTDMSAGVASATGSSITWLYYNDGSQTVTITANTGHTLVGGTAAVTTGKHMLVTSRCASAGVWVSFLTTLM